MEDSARLSIVNYEWVNGVRKARAHVYSASGAQLCEPQPREMGLHLPLDSMHRGSSRLLRLTEPRSVPSWQCHAPGRLCSRVFLQR